MNLRIAPDSLRFRLSINEFERLLLTGALAHSTQYTESARLEYAIRTHTATNSSAGHILELTSNTSGEAIRFELTVFADAIAQLQSGQCNKDGIKDHQAFANGELLNLSLEIDLHSKKGTI